MQLRTTRTSREHSLEYSTVLVLAIFSIFAPPQYYWQLGMQLKAGSHKTMPYKVKSRSYKVTLPISLYKKSFQKRVLTDIFHRKLTLHFRPTSRMPHGSVECGLPANRAAALHPTNPGRCKQEQVNVCDIVRLNCIREGRLSSSSHARRVT